MANLTVQTITRAAIGPGVTPAAAGGDTFTPSRDTFLYLFNSSGGSHTVTVATPNEVIPNVGIADVSVSVPSGGQRKIGPFPAEDFADPTDGLAHITYSGVTSLTIGAFKLSHP